MLLSSFTEDLAPAIRWGWQYCRTIFGGHKCHWVLLRGIRFSKISLHVVLSYTLLVFTLTEKEGTGTLRFQDLFSFNPSWGMEDFALHSKCIDATNANVDERPRTVREREREISALRLRDRETDGVREREMRARTHILTHTHTLTLTLMIQDSGPFSNRTMFRFSKLKLIGLGGLGMDGANQIIIVTKLKLVSELSQFRLGTLGHTLKVVLPNACPVFSWRRWYCYHIVQEAVPEITHSVCKVVAPHVETVPWFQKFQELPLVDLITFRAMWKVRAWHFVESM